MSQMKLGYWKIRGLAQPARLILNYVGQEFEDVRYEQGDAPEYSREAWESVKYKLGLDFPNLPYFIDGDIKITQSNAILRYLGKKFDLLGSNDKVYAASEMMLENAMDFRNGLVRIIYGPGDFAAASEQYFKTVHDKLKAFDGYLEGKEWFAGDKKPTICDFPMYELLDQHRLMRPECLKEYSNLQAFLTRFENLPAIKAYMKSDKFITRPVNNKSGHWQ